RSLNRFSSVSNFGRCAAAPPVGALHRVDEISAIRRFREAGDPRDVNVPPDSFWLLILTGLDRINRLSPVICASEDAGVDVSRVNEESRFEVSFILFPA